MCSVTFTSHVDICGANCPSAYINIEPWFTFSRCIGLCKTIITHIHTNLLTNTLSYNRNNCMPSKIHLSYQYNTVKICLIFLCKNTKNVKYVYRCTYHIFTIVGHLQENIHPKSACTPNMNVGLTQERTKTGGSCTKA